MSFELKKTCRAAEISSTGFLFTHHTGAKLMILQNKDSNRVFSAAFKTPPANNSGAAHIVEHCVLCGSHKYPLKDPFNELYVGCLHTYINAITFRDKTLYPVAGYHYPDFLTMVDVYMDGLFHPLLERKEVFLQEGWHQTADGKLGGIVYNEMLGAYSDPMRWLEYYAYRALFPDFCYQYDAAGVPEMIVKLSYEEYLSFYKSHYNAANCFLYFYGDIDTEKIIDRLDSFIPNDINKNGIMIAGCESSSKIIVRDEYYLSSEEQAGMLGAYYTIGNHQDYELITAVQILYEYLLNMPNAPLKVFLSEAEAGRDITGFIDTESMYPVIGVICKETGKTAQELVILMKNAFKYIIETFNYRLITACMNQYEFGLYEENYGYKPKGLAYNILALSSWIYGGDPFKRLERIKNLRTIREKGAAYFLFIIERYFLDNPHAAFISVSPKNAIAKKKAVQQDHRDTNKDELSLLEEFRKKTDDPESLARIALSDLPETALDICQTSVHEIDHVRILHHKIATNGILYIDIMFQTSSLTPELLPYLGILRYLYAKVRIKNSDVDELNTNIRTHLGGISFLFEVFPSSVSDAYIPVFNISVKVLSNKSEEAFRIAGDIVNDSIFSDKQYIRRLLQELLSKLENAYINEGDTAAIAQAMACLTESGRYSDAVSGTGLRKLLKRMLSEYDDAFPDLLERLEQVKRHVFRRSGLIINLSCKENIPEYERYIKEFAGRLPESGLPKDEQSFGYKRKNASIFSKAEISNCAMVFDYRKAGYKYTGAMAVTGQILSLDYLLKEVRLKNGAYGCGAVFQRSGTAYFYSYRDPEPKTTLKVFCNAWQFIEDYFVSDRELRKHLTGAMNKLLRPLHPVELKKRAIMYSLSDISPEALMIERDEILNCGIKDIQALSSLFREGAVQGCFAAVGPIEKIKECFPTV